MVGPAARGHGLVLDRGGGLGLGLLQPLCDVRVGEPEVLSQLAQGGEGVRVGVGEHAGGVGDRGREARDRHGGHAGKLDPALLVRTGVVQLGRGELQLVGRAGVAGRGVRVRRVHRRDIFAGVGGAGGDGEGGRGG